MIFVVHVFSTIPSSMSTLHAGWVKLASCPPGIKAGTVIRNDAECRVLWGHAHKQSFQFASYRLCTNEWTLHSPVSFKLPHSYRREWFKSDERGVVWIKVCGQDNDLIFLMVSAKGHRICVLAVNWSNQRVLGLVHCDSLHKPTNLVHIPLLSSSACTQFEGTGVTIDCDAPFILSRVRHRGIEAQLLQCQLDRSIRGPSQYFCDIVWSICNHCRHEIVSIIAFEFRRIFVVQYNYQLHTKQVWPICALAPVPLPVSTVLSACGNYVVAVGGRYAMDSKFTSIRGNRSSNSIWIYNLRRQCAYASAVRIPPQVNVLENVVVFAVHCSERRERLTFGWIRNSFKQWSTVTLLPNYLKHMMTQWFILDSVICVEHQSNTRGWTGSIDMQTLLAFVKTEDRGIADTDEIWVCESYGCDCPERHHVWQMPKE